jgi:hypothetical protein
MREATRSDGKSVVRIPQTLLQMGLNRSLGGNEQLPCHGLSLTGRSTCADEYYAYDDANGVG